MLAVVLGPVPHREYVGIELGTISAGEALAVHVGVQVHDRDDAETQQPGLGERGAAPSE